MEEDTRMKWVLPTKRVSRILSLFFAGLMLFVICCFVVYLPPSLQSNTFTQTQEGFQTPRFATSAPPIFINGTDSSNDWDNCPWINGSGTFINPYVIHDLSIDGTGSRNCIIIANTRDFLRIENCTLFNVNSYYVEGAGIRISNSTNIIYRNNTCIMNYYGIYLSSSGNCTLSQNTFVELSYGIYLTSTGNCTLSENNCSDCYHSIYLRSAENCTLSKNICIKGYGYGTGISLYSSNHCTIIENTCEEKYYGIDLSYSSNITLFANTCKLNYYDGIHLSTSWNCTLSGNTCTGNFYGHGITIYYSSNNTISTNYCTDNIDGGICLISSNDCLLTQNTCSGDNRGIEVLDCNHTAISGNICRGNNTWGIYLANSPYSNVSDNDLGRYGIYLDAGLNSAHSTSLDASNTVLGYSVRFLVDVIGATIPGDSGEVILVNCSTITVKNLSNSGFNIILLYSSNNNITGNNLTGCNGFASISLSNSNNNTITGNNCSWGSYGIYLSNSNNNTITGNNFLRGSNGIFLENSNNNAIVWNNCTEITSYCFYFWMSNYNQLFFNRRKNSEGSPIRQEIGTENEICCNYFGLIPICTFSNAPSSIWNNIIVQFNAIINGGDNPYTYQWNFGDGTENSTLQNPSHSFVKPGNYLVILTVTDFDGDISVFQIEIEVQSIWTWIAIGMIITVGIIIAVKELRLRRTTF